MTELGASPDGEGSRRGYVAQIAEMLDAGKGISIMGTYGTGKTTLAMLVSQGRPRGGQHRGRLHAARGCSA